MSTPLLRNKAMQDVLHRHAHHTEVPSMKISDYFGESVFNEDAMRKFLTEDAYYAVRQAIHGAQGELLSVLAITFLGAWPAWSILVALGLSAGNAALVAGTMLLGLLVRALIRIRVSSRSDELSRLDEPPEQRLEYQRVVVHAGEKHRLRQHGHSRVDQTANGFGELGGHLARVVDVGDQVDGGVLPQQARQLVG